MSAPGFGPVGSAAVGETGGSRLIAVDTPPKRRAVFTVSQLANRTAILPRNRTNR